MVLKESFPLPLDNCCLSLWMICTIRTLALALLLFSALNSQAQIDVLKSNINEITKSKNARVGVYIVGNDGKDTVSIYGNQPFVMQSVFKFHIAVVMLSEIDKGKFSLDQKIKITKKDLTPEIWSPIRDKYPEGVTLTIAEIIEYTLSQSDNVGCDILLALLGGPNAVEDYFKQYHFKDISIKINEKVMQNNWDLQFANWTSPESSNEVLTAFYSNRSNLLSKETHQYLWNVMKGTQSGIHRLKGLLPEGTVVAHKTGYSGANDKGVTEAVNDIGIVFLPNGKHFFISVFVTRSTENLETNERIIADIAKAAWDYFIDK